MCIPSMKCTVVSILEYAVCKPHFGYELRLADKLGQAVYYTIANSVMINLLSVNHSDYLTNVSVF